MVCALRAYIVPSWTSLVNLKIMSFRKWSMVKLNKHLLDIMIYIVLYIKIRTSGFSLWSSLIGKWVCLKDSPKWSGVLYIESIICREVVMKGFWDKTKWVDILCCAPEYLFCLCQKNWLVCILLCIIGWQY